nr:uracil phosphoribosyltransferase [Gloiopeltis furcata]
MQLNIYLVSHPLIKQLSNEIIHTSTTNNPLHYAKYNKLNILLVYEVIRKWLTIDDIYIHYLDYTKEIYKFNKKESYLIVTDLTSCGDLMSALRLMLPQINTYHIYFNKTHNKYLHNDCLYNEITTIMKAQKIIIIEKFLDHDSISPLLDYLFLEKNISMHQIRLICITCKSSLLEKIARKYPHLHIYTTKIHSY